MSSQITSNGPDKNNQRNDAPGSRIKPPDAFHPDAFRIRLSFFTYKLFFTVRNSSISAKRNFLNSGIGQAHDSEPSTQVLYRHWAVKRRIINVHQDGLNTPKWRVQSHQREILYRLVGNRTLQNCHRRSYRQIG